MQDAVNQPKNKVQPKPETSEQVKDPAGQPVEGEAREDERTNAEVESK